MRRAAKAKLTAMLDSLAANGVAANGVAALRKSYL